MVNWHKIKPRIKGIFRSKNVDLKKSVVSKLDNKIVNTNVNWINNPQNIDV